SSMLDQSSEWRQRIQKTLAVSAGDNAAVQYGDPTGVLFRSQQTANGLNQLNGCIRYGDFHERIASALGNPLRQAGFNRVIRNREWQTGDHHVVQILARQIDTFWKTGHAEHHAGPTGIHPTAMVAQPYVVVHLALCQKPLRAFWREITPYHPPLPPGGERNQC